MEFAKRLPVHRYSVNSFSYSSPWGILGSGRKEKGARGRENIVAVSVSSHEQTQ